jgi:transposase
MSRHELTDATWRRLAPLLPSQRPRTGRPAQNHQTMINAMLWLSKTGMP